MTYLTTKDLQDLIRVDKSTIYRMAEDGRIPAVKVGRQWRFPEDAVRQMLGQGPATEPSSVQRTLLASLDPDTTQAVADLAAEVFEAMVVVTGMDGRPMTEVANPCGLFSAVASEPKVLPRCIETWAHYGDVPDLVPAFRPSQFGFLCARTFVRVGNELLGMMIVGGIAPDVWPPPPAAITATAAGFGVEPTVLTDHIDEVYHLDATGRTRILDLLPRFGVLLSRMAESSSSLVGRLDAIASLVGDIDESRSA
jgi:excisionase family DNA binding protein